MTLTMNHVEVLMGAMVEGDADLVRDHLEQLQLPKAQHDAANNFIYQGDEVGLGDFLEKVVEDPNHLLRGEGRPPVAEPKKPKRRRKAQAKSALRATVRVDAAVTGAEERQRLAEIALRDAQIAVAQAEKRKQQAERAAEEAEKRQAKASTRPSKAVGRAARTAKTGQTRVDVWIPLELVAGLDAIPGNRSEKIREAIRAYLSGGSNDGETRRELARLRAEVAALPAAVARLVA